MMTFFADPSFSLRRTPGSFVLSRRDLPQGKPEPFSNSMLHIGYPKLAMWPLGGRGGGEGVHMPKSYETHR